MGEAIRKPLTPMRGRIGVAERGLHPDFAITQFDRKLRYIVCPNIKGAAAFEIKAGVMPMTGQDAVLDAAALEREAHVRTTIVESEDAPAVVDHKDRTMATVQNEAVLWPLARQGHPQTRSPCSARP
jgi:hypothetical protein